MNHEYILEQAVRLLWAKPLDALAKQPTQNLSKNLQVIGKGQLIEKYPVGNSGADGFMSLVDVRI